MHRFATSLRAGILAAALLMPALAEAAALLGSTAGISVTGSIFTASPGSAVIGNGTEFQTLFNGVGFLAIDIGAASVTYSVNPGFDFDLTASRSITLTGLTFTGPAASIASLSLTSSGITNLSLANFSFTPDSLTFAFSSMRFSAGGSITIDLIPDAVTTAVPEPGSLGLLAGGVLALGAARRRRRDPAIPA